MSVLTVLVLLVASVASEDDPTTTKTYEIEVPGADPIRIVEGEPLWKTRYEHRAFNVQDSTEEKDDSLRQFLTKYADNVRHNKIKNRYEEESSEDSTDDNKKSWDLVQYPKHNHPYDDRKGWVSMDPVPWSVSKISKWQSKYKPSTPRPWEDYDSEESPPVRPYQKPTTNYDVRPYQKPTTNYDVYYHDNKPQQSDPRPVYPKPTAVYSQKVHVDYINRNHHKHGENCKQHSIERPNFDDGEIITDGRPGDFPQAYESNRRQGTEIHTDNHPFSGQGEWVLLSTTKGYKHPRQRALQIIPDSIGTRRGVRLTVLPPLKGSKVNMTTSHGGLLQVESTFQTVEQARKQHTKKEKLKKKNQNQNQNNQIQNQNNQIQNQKNQNQKKQNQKRRPKPVRQVVPPTVTTTTRNSASDSSAMLAAVGAGMIPATMAMLVPMALGGRRKREVPYATTTPQMTLPLSLY